jgi:EAL domain-containing protein (putative c-di-GMP-specific phosphodiesterase class I)/GGDEF domain-containing protein
MTPPATAQALAHATPETAALDKYLQQLARQDQDTGLLNYEAFCAAINVELARSASKGPSSTLIELKIRGLGRVSDGYGRKASNFAIRTLADRLNALAIKDSIIGRIDHKSFGIFLCQVSDPVTALNLVKDMLRACAGSFAWNDHVMNCDAIAGIAITAREDLDALTLLHHAGLALRASGGHNGPGYAFFNPQDALAAKRRNELMGVIAKAVDNRAFHLVYQPFYSFASGKLAGFEALMRLRHPVFGSISPAEFIPIAEEIGLIGKLGAWVFEEACDTAAGWPSHLTISVNCSPAQFYTGMLISDVNQAIAKSDFPAYRLEIEITEGTILKDEDTVLSQLNSLSDMGCPIALDDFGTGYSSLSYLWKFPFSKLKIDRSFIQVLDSTPKAPGILRSIMDLSRNLGLEVTAEGIETIEQMQTLRELDCDYLQGYLCGRPTEKADLAAVILKNFAETLVHRNASPFELSQPHARRIRVIR